MGVLFFWIASFSVTGYLCFFSHFLETAHFRQKASLKEQTIVGRVLIVILAIIGLILAYNPPATILTIATQTFTGLAVLFPTTIAALYGKNMRLTFCVEIYKYLVEPTLMVEINPFKLRDDAGNNIRVRTLRPVRF